MDLGFIRVASAIPTIKVADCRHNTRQIQDLIEKADDQNVSIITFPELTITGYTCGDLFSNEFLLSEAEKSLSKLLKATANRNIICIIGMPVAFKGTVLNTAVVFQNGYILGVIPKTFLPNYKEFSEKRWFTSALQTKETDIFLCRQTAPMQTDLLFQTNLGSFSVEICEDLWATIPPSSYHALNGAELLFNLSADNEAVGKHNYLKSLVAQQASRCIAAYIFSSCGFGESTTDVVFAGNSIISEIGETIGESDRFSFDSQLIIADVDVAKIRNSRRQNTTFAESRGIHTKNYKTIHCVAKDLDDMLFRKISATPFIPEDSETLAKRCEVVLNIQTTGLAQRLLHTHSDKVVIGISGGLDSTLALLVCIKTFDKLGYGRSGIIAVTMPGFGTTDRTYNNAMTLMKGLGVTIREVSIKDACLQHFKDIQHNPEDHDITYENSQARERTQILMDIANQNGCLVIGTGDLSELALGWATYNGDHMSMYGVNASIPKTLVRHIVEWAASNINDGRSKSTLMDIVDTPISPELIPADQNGNILQKTEDIVGPYELHDFFIYHTVRNGFSPAKIYFLAQKAFKGQFDNETIKKWLRNFFYRFFTQQFKRSCLPDGPKVDISLSPRGDWKMPSDATVKMWIDECEKL